MDLYVNDTANILAQKLLVNGRFSTYEVLKGPVNAYSARIGYGRNIVRADGKTSVPEAPKSHEFFGFAKSLA